MYTYEEIPSVSHEDLDYFKKKLANSQTSEQQKKTKKQIELLEQVLEMQYHDYDR